MIMMQSAMRMISHSAKFEIALVFVRLTSLFHAPRPLLKSALRHADAKYRLRAKRRIDGSLGDEA
jgi:hypothetical protein